MARVLIPLPALDFDPTEAAVSWRMLTAAGHAVSFATPDGRPAAADDMMLTGRGLDLWGAVPVLRDWPLIGRLMRANHDARSAYAQMIADSRYLAPLRWDAVDPTAFDALLLPGGHRARGMRAYLESEVLQRLVAHFFDEQKPVAAICHGVLLAARSISGRTGRSVLHGYRTTALTWALEASAWLVGRVVRFWDPNYYRTYLEKDGQPKGYMSVQQEVRAPWRGRRISATCQGRIPIVVARPRACTAIPWKTIRRPLWSGIATMFRRDGRAMSTPSRRPLPRCFDSSRPRSTSRLYSGNGFGARSCNSSWPVASTMAVASRPSAASSNSPPV